MSNGGKKSKFLMFQYLSYDVKLGGEKKKF